MRSVRLVHMVTCLFVLALLGFVFFLDKPKGRWRIADEQVVVEKVVANAGSISFFLSFPSQAANSVLHVRPVHYLRPFKLEERIGGEWVPIEVPKRLYWAQQSSAMGLQRCLCRFLVSPHEGEYRALLVYRYRGRWDFFRLRLSNRLPKRMRQWVMPSRADGAVWTESFVVEFASKEDPSIEEANDSSGGIDSEPEGLEENE